MPRQPELHMRYRPFIKKRWPDQDWTTSKPLEREIALFMENYGFCSPRKGPDVFDTHIDILLYSINIDDVKCTLIIVFSD